MRCLQVVMLAVGGDDTAVKKKGRIRILANFQVNIVGQIVSNQELHVAEMVPR